jgi:hypothetical protein
MESIHCIHCGGFVTKPRNVEYRARSSHPTRAVPHDGPCTCAKPTLYMPVFRASARHAEPLAVSHNGSSEAHSSS